MNEKKRELLRWSRAEKIAVAVSVLVMALLAALSLFGFPGDVWRIGWGVITMAWGCYLVVREIRAKRYVYAALDMCGIAIDYWIFFVLFQ
ncbi:hypothetical protein [Adlercreutzia caecimuris]|uniref:hypothetical protein n=1 Tax=Adlercreutzia caecimuris TaxID=671266 RepID=UPI001C3ED668|nr:hypothetical protein [Adlercreutzia caecimuris]